MPPSVVLKTTDIDRFRNATGLRGSSYTITGQSAFAASVTSINLQCLRVQRFQESSPRIWHIEPEAARIAILFQTGPGPPIGWRGIQLHSSQVIPLRPGLYGWHRLSGPTTWGTISLPSRYLADISTAATGRDLTPSNNIIAMTPPPAALTQLRRLHATAGELAETTAQMLEGLPATGGLEQDLVDATLACLDQARVIQDAKSCSHRIEISRRFLTLAEAEQDRAMFLPEICAAIGTSERTLRMYFQQHLGISPKRYLLLRRVHLAQRVLAFADPRTHSITEVATRFGFWELGRFSVYYKKIFGESPSSTLRRPARRPEPPYATKSRLLERLRPASGEDPQHVAEFA